MGDGTFSDAYWNMHRNALFFSFVCLLLSAPDVFVGGEVSETLALKIGPQAGQFIVFSSLMIAAYNLVIFVLEWRQQAWPYLQKRHTVFEDKASLDANTFASLSEAARQVTEAVSSINNQMASKFATWENARNGQTFHGSIEDQFNKSRLHAVHQLNILIEEIERNERWKSNHPNGPKMDSYWPRVKESVDAIISSFDESLEGYRDNCRNVVTQTAMEASELVIRPAFEKISSGFAAIPLAKIASDVSLRRKLFSFSFQLDAVRIGLLGLLLPVGLFSIAASHFVGRYWWNVLPSFIF